MPDRARILVVDDDATLRKLLCDLLSGDGYVVDCAADGADALDHVQRHAENPPDAILLDTTMPRLNGWDFLHSYRLLPLRHAPVISMSPGASLERPSALPEVDATVEKPFDIDVLLDVLARVLSRQAA